MRAPLPGIFSYVDVGYLHPYDLFSTATMAMQAPEGRRLGVLGQELGQLFWGGSMAGKLYAKLTLGVDQYGRDIATGLDTPARKAGSIALHVGRAVSPQALVHLVEAANMLATGETEQEWAHGEIYTPWRHARWAVGGSGGSSPSGRYGDGGNVWAPGMSLNHSVPTRGSPSSVSPKRYWPRFSSNNLLSMAVPTRLAVARNLLAGPRAPSIAAKAAPSRNPCTQTVLMWVV